MPVPESVPEARVLVVEAQGSLGGTGTNAWVTPLMRNVSDGQNLNRGLTDELKRRLHGRAVVMTEHDDQRHIQDRDAVLDGAEYRTVDDVARGADDEHVAEALVEDHLGRDARVAAAEQHGGGLLPARQLGDAARTLIRVRRSAFDEAPVAVTEGAPGAGRSRGGHGSIMHVVTPTRDTRADSVPDFTPVLAWFDAAERDLARSDRA